MHGLAVALDGCVGLIEAAVDLIVLYRVDEVLPRVAKQVEVIARMADVTADAMPRLRSMKDLTAYWVEVNRLENRANKAYRRMLAELFNTPGADPITVMKHKDIIDALEAAANGFEQVAAQGRGDRRPGVLSRVDWLPVALVVVLAMGFTYTNGFHDAANAIATSVSTRALTPRIALALAAVMNLLGGFAGVRVAQTIGGDIIEVPMGALGSRRLRGRAHRRDRLEPAHLGRGLPSSSSHALIGGLCGAALAAGATVKWDSILDKVVVPMVLSPVLGLVGGFLLMTAILWTFRRVGARADGARVPLRADRLGRGDGVRPRHAGCREDRRRRRPHPGRERLPLGGRPVDPVVGHRAVGGRAQPRHVCRGVADHAHARAAHHRRRRRRTASPPRRPPLRCSTRRPPRGRPSRRRTRSTSAITRRRVRRARRKAVRWGVARSIVVAWVLTFPGAGLAAAAGLRRPLPHLLIPTDCGSPTSGGPQTRDPRR